MAELKLALQAVAIFLFCSYTSVRFLVPLMGQEFLSRCLGTVLCGVSSVCIASYATRGGKIANFRDKAVLITGCDTGMGNALARRLDGMGFRVFAGCLEAEYGEGAAGLRAECSERLKVIQMDVTSDKEVVEAVTAVEETLAKTGDAVCFFTWEGSCDILNRKIINTSLCFIYNTVLWGVVNNAGVLTFGMVEWICLDAFKKVMEVNTWGMVRVTKAFLPLIRKSKGRIVNMSSVLGRFSSPYCTPYCMTKYAVQAFTDALRVELFPWGVKAVIVEPGTFSAGTSVMLREGILNSGMERVWRSAPEEVRQAYGEDHFQSVKKALIMPILKTTHGSIVPVIDAYTSALTDEIPKDRYFPSNAMCKCIAWAHYYLPASIMDAVANLYLAFFCAKLQGLETSY
ncbi:D-beta-hydroxybutyrate dehydrogenase, mitochondrial-like [Acanthaster planci]|uniref:D-beta-hydroxybutyrate dehydrogenase, mitochondrial-like n=1 Tax=Acanthaster planci TaxID=133434 RepID=A0A8B8A0N3_ACAPL|nr:D-beta-hydroxybutyrate dehydrogenase, mitochondrial-like [Acanthaster planci]